MNKIYLLIKKLCKKIKTSSGCRYLYCYFDELVCELDAIGKVEISLDMSRALLSLIQNYADDCMYNTYGSANWVRYSARCFYCADYLTRYLEDSLQQTVEASLNRYFIRLADAGVAPVLPEDVIDKYIERVIKSETPQEIYDKLIKKAIDESHKSRLWDANEVNLALVYLRSASRLIHQYTTLYLDYTLSKNWGALLDTKHLANLWYEYPNYHYRSRYSRDVVSKYLDEMLEIQLSIIKLWFTNNPQEMIDKLYLEDLIEILEVYEDNDFEETLRYMIALPYNNKVEAILEHFTHDDESWVADLSCNLLESYHK